MKINLTPFIFNHDIFFSSVKRRYLTKGVVCQQASSYLYRLVLSDSLNFKLKVQKCISRTEEFQLQRNILFEFATNFNYVPQKNSGNR